MTECPERNRGAVLALHFAEEDESTLAEARAHVERCAACRADRAAWSGLQETLQAWTDVTPPASLRERVLARAVSTARQAPAPAPAAHALPLFALLPVMAVLVAVSRWVAAHLLTLPDLRWIRLVFVLEVLGPMGTAAFLMLAVGAFAALALAPALFLEIRTLDRRTRRTLGLHG
jgi:hypothetical protein